jgi:hypothetical protein
VGAPQDQSDLAVAVAVVEVDDLADADARRARSDGALNLAASLGRDRPMSQSVCSFSGALVAELWPTRETLRSSSHSSDMRGWAASLRVDSRTTFPLTAAAGGPEKIAGIMGSPQDAKVANANGSAARFMTARGRLYA